MAVTPGAGALEGWAPVRLLWDGPEAAVDWCRVGTGGFGEPFFDQSVEKCLRHPFNQLFLRRTPIDVMSDRQRASPGLEPRGFVFHLSRCGSTLVAQSLMALPRTVVLAEPDPIHWVLRSAPEHPEVTPDRQIAWLQAVVAALGQRWRGNETSLYIKFDAWSIVDLPLIRQAFPDVPWIFVYRDPVEVIVSHLRRRGSQVVPSAYGIRLLGVDAGAAARMPAEEYCARVLARICEAALAGYDERDALLLEYRQLSDECWPIALDFLRAGCSPDDLARVRRQARFDAKNPSVRFADDVAEKNREASALVREMAERWVMPHYRRLESLRAGRAPV
jgi:hypothetical protein